MKKIDYIETLALGSIITLALVTIVWIVFLFSIIVSERLNPLNKPYILVFEKPTQADFDHCKKDQNCMDVMDLNDLPKRDDK